MRNPKQIESNLTSRRKDKNTKRNRKNRKIS